MQRPQQGRKIEALVSQKPFQSTINTPPGKRVLAPCGMACAIIGVGDKSPGIERRGRDRGPSPLLVDQQAQVIGPTFGKSTSVLATLLKRFV